MIYITMNFLGGMILKRFFTILLILTFALAACGNQQTIENDSMSEEPNASNEELNPKLVQEFSNQIVQAASPIEVKKKLDKMIPETNAKTADALVIDYLEYQESFLQEGINKYSDQIDKLNRYFNLETESIDITLIKESDLKEFYQSFTKAGFKFIALEGMLNPIVDYTYLDAYKTKISPEIVEYGSFMALNSEKTWARDGSLAISLNELAERIAIAEKYLSDYPNAIMKEKVISQFNLYLKAFLVGIDNTPLVSYEENVVDDKFIDAYYYFIETYPDLKTTELVQTHVNELENTNLAPPYNDGEEKAVYMNKIDEEMKNIMDQI